MVEPREIIRAEVLGAVPHGFLTGIGHEGDPDPALLVPGAQLVRVKQVHSSKAVTVTAPFAENERPEVDAIVTATPGLVLAIVTADCAPVLFADTQAGVVAAAHAGWRGAHYGVLEATVRQMEALGAVKANISAALGPTIAEQNYEVGWDFCKQFDDRHERFFRRSRPGKWQFDLPAYVLWRLESMKLGRIEDLGLDTYAHEQQFHSYRRATHRGEATDGRQYSLIALPA